MQKDSLSGRKVGRSFGDAADAPIFLRIVWALSSVLLLCLLAYLATHRSENPAILGHYSRGYAAFLTLLLCAALAVSALNVRSVRRRVQRLASTVTVLALSIVFALGLAEVLVRLIDPLGISYYEEVKKYELDKLADPNLVFAHRPSRVARYQGVDVSTNGLGLRDAEIGPKSEREIRAVFLGDSVTFGWGVEQDEIFTHRLEQLLNEGSSDPIRIINTGVGGYNTVQEYEWFKRVGTSLDPNAVLLLYVINDDQINEGPFDPRSNLSMAGKSPPQVASLFAGRSWLYRLVQHVVTYRGAAYEIDSATVDALRRSRGWLDSMSALRGIADICKERQIPFVTFFGVWNDSLFTRALLEDARTAVAPFSVYDTRDWIKDEDPREITNSVVDSHPNARGHAILAENMASILKRDGVFVD